MDFEDFRPLSKVRPSDSTVTAMVDACTANGAAADARLALQEAADAGCAPAMNTYMSILKLCAQRKDMTAALQVCRSPQLPKGTRTLRHYSAMSQCPIETSRPCKV